jgi:branched-chain amino acid transport system permease protein
MVFRKKINRQVSILIVIFFIFAILPVFFGNTPFIMHLLVFSLIWACLGTIWDLVFGYAGILTLGQLGFFTIGAYASAMLTTNLMVSPWVGIIFAGVVAGIVGVLLGIPCLRLKGAYVALITFAFHLVLPTLIHRGDIIKTGGTKGIFEIVPLKIGGYVFNQLYKVPWFYVFLGLTILVFFIIYKIINSSFGSAFVAIRDSEDFAKSLGINIYKTKLMVFGLTAALAGVVGAFYAHYVGYIGSKILNFDSFLFIWVIMAIGGVSRFPGVLIGSFIITVINELLRGFETYRLLILGALVIISIIFMPNGVMGGLNAIIDRIALLIKKGQKL